MLMYKNGIPISNVKDFLGLSDISTTSIYAYADNEDIKKALETVQENIPSSSVKEKNFLGKRKRFTKILWLRVKKHYLQLLILDTRFYKVIFK